MNWTEKVWQASEAIYHKILELPFLHELMDGTLPEEKFYFYLKQDAIYLSEYGKILAGIATRLSDSNNRAAFLGFSNDTIAVESALHAFYLKDAPKVKDVGASPSCMLYTGFLSQQLLCQPVEVAIAAVLPCFWIYQKVGDYILKHQTKGENRYQNWIDTYGGEEFATAVNKALEISVEVAEKSALQDQMTEAFQYACKLEWMFWDSAYRKEKWPV